MPKVENENYQFIGELAIALYSKEIQITMSALKQILNDRGMDYSEVSNKGLGSSVRAAYHAWEKVDPVIHHAIAYTYRNKDGEIPWE
jgi:hypothetical protein